VIRVLRCGLLGAGICFLGACSSANGGIYPLPIRLPVITSLNTPGSDLAAGQQAQFSLAWAYGLPPFTVSWTFSAGTQPLAVQAETDSRTNSTTVLLVNAGQEPLDILAIVYVLDSFGNQVSRTFTFRVEPPAP